MRQVGRVRVGYAVARVVLATGAAALLASCSSSVPSTGGESGAATDSATSDAAAGVPATGSSEPSEGLSAQEAESVGVLTGDYDALVEDPVLVGTTDGCQVFATTVRNVGERADSYVFEADGVEVDTGEDGPSLDVAASAATSITITRCPDDGPALVRVLSDGLDGGLVEEIVLDR